jgi:hypothetical protein
MTVRAIVCPGPGIAAAETADPAGNGTTRATEPTGVGQACAEAGVVDATARCSPDPCQHTDRYRLVTPFSLRL